MEKSFFIFTDFLGRFLNFNSHLITHKDIVGLTDRIIRLSHPRFQQKNFIDAIIILLKNAYSLNSFFQ